MKPYFSVCEECRQHGHIIGEDGKRSKEFGTVSEGVKVLEALVVNKKIGREQAPAISRHIKESELALWDEEGDRVMDILIGLTDGTEKGLRKLFVKIHEEMIVEAAKGKGSSDKKRVFQ